MLKPEPRIEKELQLTGEISLSSEIDRSAASIIRPIGEVIEIFSPLLPGSERVNVLFAVPDRGIVLDAGTGSEAGAAETLAKVVGMVTGETVTVVEEGEIKQVFNPPAISLRLPGVLRDQFTDNSMIKVSGTKLLSLVGSLPRHLLYDEGKVKDEITNITERFPFYRPTTGAANGILTVECHNDLSVVLADWFPAALRELERVNKKYPGAAIRLAINHDENDLYRIFNREFGSLDPWRLSCFLDQDLVIASVHRKVLRSGIQPLLEELPLRFKALTGKTLDINIDSLPGVSGRQTSFVIEPRRDWRGVSLEEAEREFLKLTREVPSVLGIQKVWREQNGNRFYVEHSLRHFPEEFIGLVLSTLSDYSFPIEFRGSHLPLSEDQLQEAFHGLLRYFPLEHPRISLRQNSVQVQFYNDLSVTETEWYPIFEKCLSVLAEHAEKKVILSRRLKTEQIYNLVADHAGDSPWSIKCDEERRSVEVEVSPAMTPDEALALERVLKDKSGWSVRINVCESDEQHQEVRVPGQTFAGVHFADARLTLHYVQENIPAGLGESDVIMKGNRVVISYSNKNLPAPYLDWVRGRLSRFNLPVVLKEAPSASPVESEAQAREILEHSCPKGWWIRSVSKGRYGFQISCLAAENELSRQLEFEALVSRSFSGSTEFRVRVSESALTEFLDRTGGESAHFLASLCDSSGRVISPAGARGVFDNRFRPPVQGVGLSEPLLLRRRDLTHIHGLTIDQSNSRMLEDMLSVRKLPNGNFLLGVHIVDGSAYFPYGSKIDSVARERVCTMYGSRMVVPMVPEEIGLDQGTMQPFRSVPAISLFAEIDDHGEICDYKFHRSVVQSKRRLSYDHVDAILQGKPGHEVRPVQWLSEVTSLLSDRWYNSGIKYEFLPGGRGVVAQSMILFNHCTAEYLKETGVAFPVKVEEGPDSEGQKKLIAKTLQEGLTVPADLGGDVLSTRLLQQLREKVDRSSYLKLLKEIIPRPSYEVSSSRGMFSLGLPDYTYATSPFRDYTALTTIRILSAVLSGEQSMPAAQVKMVVDEINAFSKREEHIVAMLRHMDAIQDAGHAGRGYSIV